MGYSVLYIAFGMVALWLLGEVLLQYKARLRWRLLAFAGFMGVVGGVALREVVVIVLGAIAFGTGQTFVTLSYKRGFSTGWALGGRPGSSRRRRDGTQRTAEPLLEVTPVEVAYPPAAAAGADAGGGEDGPADQDVFQPVYRPVPIPDDSGEYPLYDDQSSYTPDPYTSGGYEGYGAQGYAGWDGEPRPAAAGASYDGGYQGGYEGGYEQAGGWGSQGYGYDPAAAQQQPAAAYDTGDTGGSGYNGYDVYGGYDSGYGSGHDANGTQVTGGTGNWSPQPHPQHREPYQDGYQDTYQNAYQDPQPQADPYAGAGYGYDPQAQPYIPQQQSPYEQPQPLHQQPHQQPQHPSQQQPQPQYAAEQPEHADPYDPYRY